MITYKVKKLATLPNNMKTTISRSSPPADCNLLLFFKLGCPLAVLESMDFF